MTHILSLPTDIWLSLFRHASISDILSLRQTCKDFYLISRLRGVWCIQIKLLLQQQDVPIPGLLDRSLDTLSTTEFEDLAVNAFRFRRNWISRSPKPSNKQVVKVGPSPAAQNAIATAFDFLPRVGERYLVSSSISRSQDSTLHLQCWDLKTSPPICIAERVINRCVAVSMNKERYSPFALAIGSHESIEVLDINFASVDPSKGFLTRTKFLHKESRLLALHGSALVTRDEHHNLYVRDVSNPGVHFELQSYNKTSEKVLEVILHGDVVIVARLTRLEIYSIHGLGTTTAIISPVTEHVWSWSVDSVSLAVQTSWTQKTYAYAPVNILLRFGSRLPWPVNLIHHFILHPNVTFEHAEPINPNNLPYNVIPVLRQQIGSPVRLFSHYHMALGSRGTAVYIDSHTEDYFCRGDCGQRLAGSLSGTIDPEDQNCDDEHGAVLGSQVGSSIFNYCENDEWTRVAVDEEEGRIAVGCLDGTIMIYEYA